MSEQKWIDQLKHEHDLYQKHLRVLEKEIEKLEAENAELKDVLCFYANGYAHEIDDSCNAYYESGHIRLASGKRARQVLKELENK